MIYRVSYFEEKFIIPKDNALLYLGFILDSFYITMKK